MNVVCSNRSTYMPTFNDYTKASLNGDFIRVLYTLNMLMWHYINKERDDKSFVGVERVSSLWNSSALFLKYDVLKTESWNPRMT